MKEEQKHIGQESLSSRIEYLGSQLRMAGATGKKVHVMSRQGQWVVFKEGAARVISEYASKETAVLIGEKIAKQNAAESLVIHKEDGSIARWVNLVE